MLLNHSNESDTDPGCNHFYPNGLWNDMHFIFRYVYIFYEMAPGTDD